MCWPDTTPEWRNVDQYPNTAARQVAWEVFERLSKLDAAAAFRIGACKSEFDKVPYLRFDDEAHADFLGWRKDLEGRLRSGELSPALEGHLAKYRTLVPALALINHLADKGQNAVSHAALLKALAFAHYLENHARRVYGASSTIDLAAGKSILAHIRNGDLKDGFTARDVHQRGWTNLTSREHVQAGLDLLVDLDYLAEIIPKIGKLGGRPKLSYDVNPRVLL